MENFQVLFAERIGGESFGTTTELFKFEKIKRAKRAAIKEHPELALIDLGVGEPDETADMGIIDKLSEQARLWINRGYADNGIIEFQKAAALYMDKVYSVQGLLPDTEILPVMGSKSALSLLPQAFINPGDITLMTVPGYPVMGTITEWLGGIVYKLPLRKDNRYLPDLKHIPADVCKKAKLLYLNYPNNPTGSQATKEFFSEVIDFAQENNIIVIQDAAYAALTYGDSKPLSFLSVSGAKEVGVEIHSLSKAFNMTGWRIGFACGNEILIKALAAVKDNYDSGQFRAIQHAGVYALEHPEITEKACKKYERRHQKLAYALQEVGFEVEVPEASFYQYIKIPKGTEDGIVFDNAEQFAQYLIQKVLISAVPWDDEGHYLRLSVTFVADSLMEEDKVLAKIRERMLSCKFVFE